MTPGQTITPPLACEQTTFHASTDEGQQRIDRMPYGSEQSLARIPLTKLSGWLFLIASGVLVYFGCMTSLAGRWWNEPDYSYGFLVPVIAGFMLWHRRGLLCGARPYGVRLGLVLLAISAIMRWASAYYYYELGDPASIIPALAGLVLFLGGWNVLRWAAPSLAMLVFMIPLPGFLATQLAQPLQRVATIASTYMIQTMGVPAVAEGNVISLGEAQIGVAEACDGLRNMMLFVAVCSAAAFIMDRSVLQKTIIFLSAAPIAIIANVLRITATAMLHSMALPQWAHTTFHELAGWFMMPVAVVLLLIEVALLRRIFVPAPPSGPIRA